MNSNGLGGKLVKERGPKHGICLELATRMHQKLKLCNGISYNRIILYFTLLYYFYETVEYCTIVLLLILIVALVLVQVLLVVLVLVLVVLVVLVLVVV